jgi:hypothetical protein
MVKSGIKGGRDWEGLKSATVTVLLLLAAGIIGVVLLLCHLGSLGMPNPR